MGWTKEQLAAMERDCGNLLVSAGAGSGKTAVLIQRIMGILTEARVDVDRLLVLTYTNAAAAEMRQRLGAALRERLGQEPENRELAAWLGRELTLLPGAKIMTIHSFCLELLREYSYALSLDPKSRIGSEGELAMLRDKVLNEVFEEAYLEAESPLKLLLDHYSQGIGDEHIRGLILRLLEFGQSMPDVEEWLAGLTKVYEIDSENNDHNNEEKNAEAEEQGAAAQWVSYFGQCMARELAEQRAVLAAARELAENSAGTGAYAGTLALEEEAIGKAVAAFEQSERSEQDFAGGMAAFGQIQFGRLPAIRAKAGVNIDMEAKEKIQLMRKQVKDTVAELRREAAPISNGTLAAELRELAPLAQALTGLCRRFYRAWQQAKRQRKLLEFADLEHYALELLGDERLGARETLRERFYEILVDEYQDINQVQERLLELLTNGHNRFMVGDIKQSIYRFRLAEPGLFLRRFEAYGRGENGRRIDLNRNFRSQAGVLAAVNFIFGQLMQGGDMEISYGAEAMLYCGRPELPENPVELLLIDRRAVEQSAGTGDRELANDENNNENNDENDNKEEDIYNEENAPADVPVNGAIAWQSGSDRWLAELKGAELEARLLAERVGRELAAGRRPGEIVILLRAVRSWAPIVSRALREQGIACQAQGFDDFLSLPEVQLVYNLLQVLDNPRQDIPLAALLHSPLVGLKLAELADLRILGRKKAGRAGGWVYEGVCLSHDRRLSELKEKLRIWRGKARELSAGELLDYLYNGASLPELVGALPGGELRRQSLRQLRRLAGEYDAGGGLGLSRFLQFLQAAGRGPLGETPAGEEGECVRIMSIHRSKGLEFPCVFVAGLGTAFNEMDYRQDVLLHRSLGLGMRRVDLTGRRKLPSFGFNVIARKSRWENLAEALRILYVAMTRAEQKLYLVGTCTSAEALGRQLAGLQEVGSSFLGRRRSFLPWVCACLLRHPDGGALRQLVGEAESRIDRSLAGAEGRWRIEIVNELAQVDKRLADGKRFDFNAWLRQDNDNQDNAKNELRERVAKALAREYPGAELARLPVKWSASAFKRLEPLSAEPAENEAEEARLAMLGEEFAEDLQAVGRGLNWYSEYGRAVHRLLQQADLESLGQNPGPDWGAAHFRELIGKLGQEGVWGQEILQAVNPRQLAAFFGGELGRRLLAANKQEKGGQQRVLREQRFIAALTLRELAELDREVWERLDSGVGGLDLSKWGEEKLFLQGVIDLAFWEEGPEPGWVLVDYKSGGNRGKSSEQVLADYGLQLGIYRLALTKACGQRVKEGYIYFTANARTVRLF